MPANEPTTTEVGHSLAVFGNYRVLRSQQLCEANENFPHPSTAMALGLRETGLANIDGGAVMENGVWVRTFTDRGCFQIAESEARDWLKSVPGCPEGQWGPKAGHNALEPHYCPRFTDALEYTIREFNGHRRQAEENFVASKDLERFCVAAHNAGFTGALNGYREGNVDKNTALGDYSAWVLKYAKVIHNWVVAHPHWVYDGQPL
jgi:hypothetical protein